MNKAAPVSSVAPPLRAAPWQADQGDGTYRNPVLHADYSDPDVVRVGDDYWMVASSFCHVPGLPLLHSRDLVNWELVGHALPRLVPEENFRLVQHGKGVWAPAIRHHAGRFWIYYPDPDFGLYVITAADPRGPWSEPVLVRAGRGFIDPCPLWDVDGQLYLVHAWAKSRAGISNRITLLRLSTDGQRVEQDLGVIIDGDRVEIPNFHTLEGPKFYRRHGWYYVFAPAGGVERGWQSVFRARQLTGPYEHRVVLAQGDTPVNGPHQGAWIDTPAGEDWFVHFQDKDAYGRVVHLQPVRWHDDWPVIGDDPDGDGSGQPVLMHAKPAGDPQPPQVPAASDDFARTALGLQWQWQANPNPAWASLTVARGRLRLTAVEAALPTNLYQTPHLLLQKFPAPAFSVTTEVDLVSDGVDDFHAGLIVFGYDYAWLGLRRRRDGVALVQAIRCEARKGETENVVTVLPRVSGPVRLRVAVAADGKCQFSYRHEGSSFVSLASTAFTATKAHWVGAKVGLFAAGKGSADFAAFEVTA